MKSVVLASLLAVTTSLIAHEHIMTIQSTDEFAHLLATSEKPVAAQFHSSCPVCNATRIHMQGLAKEIDAVTFVEVDINNIPGIAQQYGITALPTVLIFSPGTDSPRHKIVGPSRDKLLYKINETLQAGA